MTCGFLMQLVFCKKKKTMWFIGVEVEKETSAPPPKKNPVAFFEKSKYCLLDQATYFKDTTRKIMLLK